jgi:hypothetical protein
VLGKRGAVAAYRRRTGAGGGAPRNDGAIPLAGGRESGGEVARQLPCDDVCGRTNLNYTGSSTRVHSRGLQRTSNGIIPWSVG